MRSAPRSLAIFLLLISASTPKALSGQRADRLAEIREAHRPGWMSRWSPLAGVGRHDRQLPSAPAALDLLGAPPPRVGQLWSAGNPGALPHEVGDAWGELRLRGGREAGDYHRPLDVDDIRVIQVAGLRWQPLGERSAVAGRLVADETESDGSYSPLLVRHSPDPFVLTDTTTPPLRHVRVRVEGAYGWRAGPWGVGLGLGLEVSDDRSREAAAARLGRTALPGVTVGLVRLVTAARISLGAYGRWRGGNENSRIALPPGVVTEVRALDGLGDPEPRQVVGPSVFQENVDRRTLAAGLSLAGTAAGWSWVARVEKENLQADHERQRLAEEPPNRWDSEAWRLAGAVQGRLGRALATVSATYTTLNGDAFRRDLVGQGAIFRADESLFRGSMELRAARADSIWIAGVRVSLERESRMRRDFLVNARSNIETWLPGVSVEVARRLSVRTAVSLGGAFAAYEPTAALPDPDALGPIHRQLIAPELALYAARARPFSVAATLRQSLERGPTLLLKSRFERLGPVDDPAGLLGDSRTRWSVELAAIWASM